MSGFILAEKGRKSSDTYKIKGLNAVEKKKNNLFTLLLVLSPETSAFPCNGGRAETDACPCPLSPHHMLWYGNCAHRDDGISFVCWVYRYRRAQRQIRLQGERGEKMGPNFDLNNNGNMRW